MTTPVFNLPTSGSDPKRATKEDLEENINQIIQYLDNARIVGDDRGTEGFYNAGPWDASTGAFPTFRGRGGSVQNGDVFFVPDDGAGTVDGVSFSAGQRLIALVDGPPSNSYAGNWFKSGTLAILEPLTGRVDAQPVYFDTMADFFSATLVQIKLFANATSGFAYVHIKSEDVKYKIDLAQTSTDYNFTTPDTGIKVKVLRGRKGYNLKAFGWIGGLGRNEVASFRAAMAALEARGGGKVIVPWGITCLGPADDPNGWCVVVPSNVKVKGEDKIGSIVRHLDPEVRSMLFVNKGADTATGYNAAGNIDFESFTMRMADDGVEIFTVSSFIGFGHGDKLRVKNMNFGQHSGHCLDIGGSKNVKFTHNDCHSTNGLTGYAANSDVQVDSAADEAFTGLNIDGTTSKHVTIAHSDIYNKHTNEVIHIGHNGGSPAHVSIYRCNIKGADRNYASLVRCDADNASLSGINLSRCLLETEAQNNQAMVSFQTNANNGEVFRNIGVENCVLRGPCRIGVQLGGRAFGNGFYAGGDLPDISGLNVFGNEFDLDFSDSGGDFSAAVFVALCRGARVEGNWGKVQIDTDASKKVFGILGATCDVEIGGNSVDVSIGTYTGANVTAVISVDRFSDVATDANVCQKVVDNIIDVTSVKYGIYSFNNEFGNKLLFSGNDFRGDLVNGDAHIYECIPSSDGTNGYRSIPLTAGGTYTLTLGTDSTYQIDTGLIKKSRYGYVRSKERIDVNFAPGGIGQLATATETLLNDADVGVQWTTNPTTGTITFETGSTGLTRSIVVGGADSNRTFGTISMMAGI